MDMAEPVKQDPEVPSAGDRWRADELRDLLNEQLRLRSDIERLREEHRQLQQNTSKNGAHPVEEGESAQETPPEPAPKRPMRERLRDWRRSHPLRAAILFAAVIILAIGAFFLWKYLQSYVSTDDAEVDGHTNPISARVAGAVTGVYVENDQSVAKGQTVVDLDPRDYKTAVAHAQANLAQAEANVQAEAPNVPITETAQATNVQNTQLDVSNAEAALQAARDSYQAALEDVQQSEARAANARIEEVRYRQLSEKDEVSREQYDQRLTEVRTQEAAVRSRAAAAESARRVVEQRQAALAEARQRAKEAQVNRPRQVAVQNATVATRRAVAEAARAQLQQALLNLSYCKIVAPVAGIVGAKTVEVGQQVAPGQALFAITQTGDLWVTANFKETQVRGMHPGQSATISVDALGQKFDGYVENLPGATGARYSLLPPENATGNFVKVVQRLPVRLRFKPGQAGLDRLRPGMSVEPKVWLK